MRTIDIDRIGRGLAAAAVLAGLAIAMPVTAQERRGREPEPARESQLLELLERQSEILKRNGLVTASEYEEMRRLLEAERSAASKDRSVLEREIERYVQEAQAKAGSAEGSSAFQTGYKDGFFLKSPDGNYSLTIGGFVQARYTYVDADDVDDDSAALNPNLSALDRPATTDTSSIDLRRARFSLKGNVIDPTIKYEVVVETEGSSATLQNYFIDYTRLDPFNLKIGQYKSPFARQFIVSSTALLFQERSRAVNFFAPQRRTGAGIMAYGAFAGENSDLFEYYAGLFNGEGQNVGTNDGPGLMGVARVAFNPLGAYGYSEPDIDRNEDPKATVGAAIAYDPDDSVSVGSAALGDVDTTTIGLEAGAKWRGFSVQGEYFTADYDPDDGATDDFDADGWYGQAGYLIEGTDLEVAARYGRVTDSDGGLFGGDETDFDEWSLGVNYYFHKHRAKVQADWTGYSADPDGGDETDDGVFRVQVQLMF